jgi:hypothetical protein
MSPSPSPSPAKTKGSAAGVERTAFTELMKGGVAAVQRDEAKKRSEFVEDQAVESDEDDNLGFGGIRKKGDEEEDEHDTDGVVEALVDDTHMDSAALAKTKVLEKHL